MGTIKHLLLRCNKLSIAIVILMFYGICCYPEKSCLENLKVYDTILYPHYKMQLPPKESGAIRIFLSASTSPALYSERAYEYFASSLTMAYTDFCEAAGGVQMKKFEIVVLDDECNASIGVSNIVTMQDAGVDIILGMGCSVVTIPCGYFMKYFDIPLISYGSDSPEISNKVRYNTVIRMGTGYKYMGLAFTEIMHTFNWQTVSMVTDTSKYCSYGISYISTYIKSQPNMTVVEINKVLAGTSHAELSVYLNNFKERARILVVCLSEEKLTQLLEIAHDQGMVTSEYAYLTFTRSGFTDMLQPWGSVTGLSAQAVIKRREAFSSLKILSLPDIHSEENKQQGVFLKEVVTKMAEYPWNINVSTSSPYGLILYDAMWFYLQFVNDSTDNSGKGTDLFAKAKNSIFTGMSGEVYMDNIADRIPHYEIWQLTPGQQQFTPFANIKMVAPEGQRISINSAPYWGTNDGEPPLNKPLCGYRHELCPPSTKGRDAALIGGFSSLAFVIIVIYSSILVYRRKKFEGDVQKMTWKILKEDIDLNTKRNTANSVISSLRSLSDAGNARSRKQSKSMGSSHIHQDQIFTKVGIYKGAMCAVKVVEKTDCKLTRTDLVDLKNAKDLSHENINVFLGACLDAPNIFILTNYCAKGSLQDILGQDEIKLDSMFKRSIISDLIKGLVYIHNSPVISHGHLSSNCCLIDSRWVLKIGCSGLQTITYSNIKQKGNKEYKKFKGEVWTAPELLRMDESLRPIKGTQKGDIYSFSIILQEILFRVPPFFNEDMDPKAIIQNVKKYSDPPFRPQIISKKQDDIDKRMVTLMEDCWNDIPDLRPTIHNVRRKFEHFNEGRKVDILDNIVQKLERYANNLEEIVEKRTEDLVVEKKKTDSLLYRMLPSVVAEKLKNGLAVPPEIYESVSIYFSDIVGFTSISSDSSPMQVVDLLNDLYTLFDDIIAKHDVYKVETIGDAYMCVSGCPNRNGDKHASEIANMSLALRENVTKFHIRHMPDRQVMIRIGLHSGSCAAGVVGLTMPRYCLFGDTVNVASRMESNGQAMKIHISSETYNILMDMEDTYKLSCRGQVELKGKGQVTTFWLDRIDK